MSTQEQPVAAAGQARSRATTVLLSTAAAVVVVAGLRGASGIVGPAFLALVLTIAVHPVQSYVQRRGWPRWAGILVGIAAVYTLVLTLAVALVASLARFATLLPEYQEDAQNAIKNLTDALGKAGVGQAQQEAVQNAFDFGRLAGFVLDILGNLASLASSLFFVVTLLLFMAMDAALLPRKLALERPAHGDMVDALKSFANGTRQYLVVSSVFGFFVAIVDTLALWALGVPAPFVWGLLSFITNYIPNIGFVIGLIPPAILALLDGGWSKMLTVIVVYCVVNFIIQSVIQPKFVGDAVGLSGTVTMASLVFWSWVLGALGALLAVPLTLLIRAILVEADPTARWILPLLSGTPPDSDQDDDGHAL
jgi:AI-2 transport protein TqsA